MRKGGQKELKKRGRAEETYRAMEGDTVKGRERKEKREKDLIWNSMQNRREQHHSY